eukprot:scaffold111855_cov48-Phaeocystis_antarctica.AAC.2
MEKGAAGAGSFWAPGRRRVRLSGSGKGRHSHTGFQRGRGTGQCFRQCFTTFRPRGFQWGSTRGQNCEHYTLSTSLTRDRGTVSDPAVAAPRRVRSGERPGAAGDTRSKHFVSTFLGKVGCHESRKNEYASTSRSITTYTQPTGPHWHQRIRWQRAQECSSRSRAGRWRCP